MTTEHERDLRLAHEIRAAFAEVVPLGADPALATSIHATVDRMPVRRPGLTVHGRPAAVFGWLAVAAIVVSVVVLALPLVIGTGRDGPSSNPGQVIGTSPSPRVSAEPEASSTPPPTPNATASGALPAGVGPVHKDMFGDLEVDQARLVTEDVGWVAAGRILYRTADGGVTWSQVDLPRNGEVFATTIVDADTAFVEYRSLPVSIWATDDGGVTWTKADFDPTYADMRLVLSFRTPLIGSATFFEGDAGRLHVFHTSDGGRTWVGPFDAKLPAGQVKTTPDRGSALALNEGKADGVPFSDRLWLSIDGGQTWPKRTFPIDQVAPAGTLKWVTGTPLVDGYGRIVLPIAIADGPNALYESTDDGQTWRLLKTWEPPTNGDLAWQALSDSTWVLADRDGVAVWSTTNGGAVWRRVVGETTAKDLGLSWATPDHGWGVHRCNRDPSSPSDPDPLCDGNQLKSVLLVTTDGGQTWTPIGG